MTISPRICALGSVNLDLIIKTAQLPSPGETVTQGIYESLPGGKGANVALAAKRLGTDVDLIAAVGKDDYAGQALQFLKEGGVNLSQLVEINQTHTGLAFINVNDQGENQIAVASGANICLTPQAISKIQIDADAVITQFEIPVETILHVMESFDGFFSVNASPVLPILDQIKPRADLIIVNEGEAKNYEHDLKDYGGLLAITLGSKGAILQQKGKELARAIPPQIEVVDTTGAGDSFAAALTVALMEGFSHMDALEFACVVGALTTTKMGTQAATPYRSDVDQLIRSLKH